MSDRDPESDWSQPRPDFNLGAGPGTAGARPHDHETPLAASSWQRNSRAILTIGVAVALCVLGVVVFLVVGNA